MVEEMNEIAVSIIIPIYNAEGFLRKGLDSCVSQTLQNIEILCVNDASTDRSSAVIEEYVNKYPNKVIHLELVKNSGQGGARNQGILHAKGEYLCFMDSDDYLDVHLCEDAYKKAKAEDADMVFYDYIRVDGERKYHVELIGEEELGAWYQQMGCAVWLQMVKREIVLGNKLFLPENMRADDDAMVPLWRYYARKRCKLQKPYYYYVNRQNSLVNEIKMSSVMAPVINVIPYRYSIMKQKGLLDEYKAESDWMISRDISITLKRLMKLKEYFTEENILNMHKQIEFLKEEQLDDSIMKYYMTCLDVELVNDFLHCPNIIVEKYGDYEKYTNLQNKKGLCESIEGDIEDILLELQACYGVNMAIWGAGRAGLPIISTLYRMGYKMHVYDNTQYGRKVLKDSNDYVLAFKDLSEESINAILVTSDDYYKEIENQVHENYPDIAVVNFRRMIRNKGFNRSTLIH